MAHGIEPQAARRKKPLAYMWGSPRSFCLQYIGDCFALPCWKLSSRGDHENLCVKGFNMCMAQAGTPIWSRASELAVQGLDNKFELPAVDCMGMKKRWHKDSRQSAAAPFPSVFIGHLIVFANLTLLAETHIELYPKLSLTKKHTCPGTERSFQMKHETQKKCVKLSFPNFTATPNHLCGKRNGLVSLNPIGSKKHVTEALSPLFSIPATSLLIVFLLQCLPEMPL